jgi:hypothetical protein
MSQENIRSEHNNNSPSWKRMSLAQASEYAYSLAIDFLEQQDTKGWRWKCGEAFPDPIDPQYRGRKVPINWCVLVRWSRDDISVFDGPSVLKIDIETNSVMFSE